MFMLVGSSDHITGATGASPTVTISKAGAAFAGAGGTVTEVSSGWYKIALTTTDTGTLGDLAFHITGTSADPADFVDQVTANILGDTLPANATQIGGQTASASGTVTFPNATLASTTNITAGTMTTTTNLTNAPSAGDFTSTMKTSIGTAVAASAVASVTGAVGSVTGNVGGNVTGSVGSVTGAVGSVTGSVGGNVTGHVASVTGAVGSITGVTFPTNFASMEINGSGQVTVDGTSALTESYSTLGSGLTLAQALYDMHQLMYQQSITSTTLTVQKRNQSTTAKTITLNSSTAPTSGVEAS